MLTLVTSRSGFHYQYAGIRLWSRSNVSLRPVLWCLLSDPGDQEDILPQPWGQLEPNPCVGQIHTQLSQESRHQPHSLPTRTRLPTVHVSLVGEPLGPRFDLSSLLSLTGCQKSRADKRRTATPTYHTGQDRRSGSLPEISVFIWPARRWFLAILVHLLLRNKSTQSPFHLYLPAYYHIAPTFYVLLLKPYSSSFFVLFTEPDRPNDPPSVLLLDDELWLTASGESSWVPHWLGSLRSWGEFLGTSRWHTGSDPTE